MTANSDDKRQRTVFYLKRSLQLNPLYESEKILRHRSRALGLTKSKSMPTRSNLAAKRNRLQKEIIAIRADCWNQPVEPLLARLEELSLENQPDLQRTAVRLRVILTNRKKLPELAQHKHFDEKFLSCFKQILTLPPCELAIPREQVVASFRNRKLRRRGMKMLQLLECEVPELCQLEQDWLDSLKRQKVNRDLVVKASSYESVPVGNSKPGINWWLIWIIFIVVVNILKVLG